MRTRLPLLLALMAGLVLAGCGQEAQDEGGFQTEIAQVAETEAIYIDIDGLKYQVQVSRQLNPLTPDDRDYLRGLPEDVATLRDDEEWFAVFMRVENHEDEAQQLAEDFEIKDTQENVYRPLELGRENLFAYRPSRVESDEIYPGTNTVAGERQPYAALLLFKVRRFSLDNRPLELEFVGPRSGKRASVTLDV